MKNARLLLLTLAATTLVAAGCGSSKDSSSDSTSTPAAASTSTPAASTSTPAASTSTPTSTPTASNPQVQAAVKQCKQSIDAQPTLKSDVKADLEKLCDKAASGNPEDVKKATKEVCQKIVESSVPAGAARDQAEQACDAAGA